MVRGEGFLFRCLFEAQHASVDSFPPALPMCHASARHLVSALRKKPVWALEATHQFSEVAMDNHQFQEEQHLQYVHVKAWKLQALVNSRSFWKVTFDSRDITKEFQKLAQRQSRIAATQPKARAK